MPRAAIVGNLVLDVVAGAPERPGGMVWYCARALSEIDPDADVVLVCRSAVEDREALVPRLEEFGFPITWQAAAQTTRFSFHYEGDRRIMAIDSLAEPWTPADIDSCDAVLAAFTAPDEGTSMEAWYAHSKGIPVVAYTGGEPVHPWTVYVSGSVHVALEDAVAAACSA